MKLLLRSIALLFTLLISAASIAAAKSIKLEWKEIKGAVHYEIRVEKSGKVVAHKVQDGTAWKGDLDAGVYSWQIRAFDRTKRPGVWSDSHPIVVMVSAPELSSPKDGAESVLYNPQAGTIFRWKAVAGVSKYNFTIKSGQKTFFTKSISATELEVPALPAGQYTWTVQSVMEPGDRAPASFTSKHWESEADEKREITIAQRKLEAPMPVFPIGILALPADKKLRFKWKAVEGAHSYHVTVSRKADARSPASTPSTTKTYQVDTNSVDIPMSVAPATGDYEWRVSAVANEDSKVGSPSIGPESRAAFRLDQNAAFVDGSGYVAFSTMFAPYTYAVSSPVNNITGKVSSTATTARASGEYWFRPKWAVGFGFDDTMVGINGAVYSRMSVESQLKYRLQLSSGRYNWSVSPKAGAEARQYIMITSTSASQNVMALGPDFGFDLRKQFTDSWSVGIKVTYFFPVSGAPAGSQMSGDSSYRNLSIGGQGLCWLNRRWGVGMGAFIDQRSISYTTPKSTLPETISMDGTYFFGSVVYSFGK